MDGLIDPKINIGANREINVALHKSKRHLVVCRMMTSAELENRLSTFPFTSVCLSKACVATLLAKGDDLAQKLEEVALGFPILDAKVPLGENMYVSVDSESYAVQIRRYWDSPDGPRPTRTGVAMTAGEMLNLLKILADFHSKMVDKLM